MKKILTRIFKLLTGIYKLVTGIYKLPKRAQYMTDPSVILFLFTLSNVIGKSHNDLLLLEIVGILTLSK